MAGDAARGLAPVVSGYGGRLVTVPYDNDRQNPEALIDAADENHGVVPPLAMVAAFPGRPELHTDTRIREALLLAGCDEA